MFLQTRVLLYGVESIASPGGCYNALYLTHEELNHTEFSLYFCTTLSIPELSVD
jgi:hypothetical protein